MRVVLAIILFCIYNISFSQSISENDIKQLALQINDEIHGFDIGNGIIGRGCFAFGRTLVYQYDVNEYWYPTENMKEDIISNLKDSGNSEMFFNNDINVNYYYYSDTKLLKTISIKSKELSNLNFSLGDYISIKGHPKAKGVSLKLRPPNGWKIEEGDRPNIVKKFVYKGNTYLIMVTDNATFFSRDEVRELLFDDEYVNEFIEEASSYLKDSETISKKIVTVDTYPTLVFTIRGIEEKSGYNIKFRMKNWIIFYEDKVVFLQCAGLDGKEFKTLESLYNLITNSVIFPEQYN